MNIPTIFLFSLFVGLWWAWLPPIVKFCKKWENWLQTDNRGNYEQGYRDALKNVESVILRDGAGNVREIIKHISLDTKRE